MSKPLRFEDVHPPAEPKLNQLRNFWYVEEPTTKTIIAIENPHLEADGDEDGIWYAPAYDGLKILDNGEWRDATDEEGDEYSDDVHDWLRALDWSR